MESFIQRHASSVMGVLNGFDRLRFRGTLRWLCRGDRAGRYLSAMGVRLTQFKEFTQKMTARMRESIEGVAQAAGRPIQFVAKPSVSKEDLARSIAEKDGIREGLIAVLAAVEPCKSFCIRRDRNTGYIEIENALRKCNHYYSYWFDPEWGFCHVRMQSWMPFTVHICINGREWLGRQMDRAGIAYRRRENCFVWVQDVKRTQALLDQQLKTNWKARLRRLLQRSHPQYSRILNLHSDVDYYWTASESEWASDVMFRSPQRLADLYPQLIDYGMRHMSSREVMRYLGRWVPTKGGVNKQFDGQVITDLRERPEGIRIKHRVDNNSIKMYDKQGSVLRVETTINEPWDFKVFRRKEGEPRGKKEWRGLRRGVADMHRRSQVSQAANERYLESLAVVNEKTPLGPLVQNLCQPIRRGGRRARALNPLSARDARLLETVNRGEFALKGFRNRDLRGFLHPPTSDPAMLKKQSAAVTRQLRLLRDHRLIRKMSSTHRYTLTKKGRLAISALLAARAADTSKLTSAAA